MFVIIFNKCHLFNVFTFQTAPKGLRAISTRIAISRLLSLFILVSTVMVLYSSVFVIMVSKNKY